MTNRIRARVRDQHQPDDLQTLQQRSDERTERLLSLVREPARHGTVVTFPGRKPAIVL